MNRCANQHPLVARVQWIARRAIDVCAAAVLCACAQAQSPTAKAIPPSNFTPEERALFVEARDMFPRKLMPRLWNDNSGQIGFIDNTRVLMSVRELPSGWKAEKNELSKIVAIDTETGAIEETPHRGALLCVSPQRIVVRDYPTPETNYVKPGDTPSADKKHVAVGKFGEPLQSMEWPQNHVLMNVGCQIALPRDFPTDKMLRYTPLLPGHGKLVDSWKPGEMQWSLINDHGKTLRTVPFSQGRGPVAMGVTYLPWRREYLLRDAIGRAMPIQLISPDGAYTPVQAPELLLRMAAQYIGSGYGTVMRDGTLWTFIAKQAYYPRQGVYWQAGDVLRRIDDGAVVIRNTFSQDGCRFFYGRIPDDEFRISNFKDEFDNYVIDFCKGFAK